MKTGKRRERSIELAQGRALRDEGAELLNCYTELNRLDCLILTEANSFSLKNGLGLENLQSTR